MDILKFVFILIVLVPFSTKAQEPAITLDSLLFPEIGITYQAPPNAPFSFQNIPSGRLKSISIGQEPSFLLKETPSMTNYSDGGNAQGYSYFRLRGIDQTRINISLDGVPLNEPEDQGAYFSNYPDLMNSVKRIQIQRGVGLSKNGSASYAGSVQLFSPSLHDSTQTTFGLSYGSFNSLRVFGAYKSGLKNNKALYVRASQIYSDGYKDNAFNNSQSIFISAGIFNNNSTWKLNILAGQQQNGMAWLGVSDSLIQINPKTNANASQERDRFLQSLAQLQNRWQIDGNSILHTSVYYTFLNGNYDFDLNNYLGLPSTSELYNYNFRSHLIGLFSTFTRYKTSKWNWTSGLHANTYNRKHLGSELALGELYDNTGFKNEASLFSKIDFNLKKLNFYADLQYRYTQFNYKGSVKMDQLDWSFVNPKAGISLRFTPRSSLYLSSGFTGREPTRNDIFGGNDDLAADSLGLPSLFNTKAEYVLDNELGFRYKRKEVQFDFNLYYMNFNNEIVLNGNFGPNALVLTDNVEQSYRTGAELSVQWQIHPNILLLNNSSWNYSRIQDQGEVFSPILTPPLLVNQEVVYNYKAFTFALIGRYQHAAYIDFANSAEVESYFLLDSRISYAYKGVKVSAFLNNLTNVRYYNYGYVDFDGSSKFFVQAPFSTFLALQYQF